MNHSYLPPTEDNPNSPVIEQRCKHCGQVRFTYVKSGSFKYLGRNDKWQNSPPPCLIVEHGAPVVNIKQNFDAQATLKARFSEALVLLNLIASEPGNINYLRMVNNYLRCEGYKDDLKMLGNG